MYEEQGHILPTRMVVENVSRGTTTEVIFERLAINPDIDDRIFSARSLEQKRDIPTRH
jgi:outer membrane lipoprotein-sorting protein